ncbi:MAG: hypothetical protein A2901_03275 [Elusimicrobia bacterium RIFCSPLOWO2_01_FULL_54_10]|nr:MAG: hypothetical protein A2901_03275 [Elusimicrobia bacterium RIFCSPLOWO2_01_FULL_54_10]
MSTTKKSLSRYTSDWSARIEFLKNSLATESAAREPRFRSEQHPQSMDVSSDQLKKIAEKLEMLSDHVKGLQETSTHEIRRISKKFLELEEFVKVKEIDLQNLKSDAVEFRLVHQELKDKIADGSKKGTEARERLEKNVGELADLIGELKKHLNPKSARPAEPTAESSVVDIPFISEADEAAPITDLQDEKSAFHKWVNWWNEPVTKITVPNPGTDPEKD